MAKEEDRMAEMEAEQKAEKKEEEKTERTESLCIPRAMQRWILMNAHKSPPYRQSGWYQMYLHMNDWYVRNQMWHYSQQ